MNTAQTPPIILASTSPFRKELLGRLNLPFVTVAPDVDESRLDNEPATDLVGRLSEAKARAVGATHEGLIIGSDQVATHGETILGKPCRVLAGDLSPGGMVDVAFLQRLHAHALRDTVSP